MKRSEQIVYRAGNTHIETILINGLSQYSKKPKAHYIKEGFEIYDTWEEVSKIIHDLETKRLIGNWEEITEERHDDMLNCLPPKNWVSGAFMMCEYYTSNITSFYLIVNNRYFTARRRDTTKYTDCKTEIINQFNL